MKARRFVVSRVLAAVVAPVVALLLVAPSPSLARGQKPPPAPPSFFASAVAYEVAEHLRFKGGSGDPMNCAVRFARATLLGQILSGAESPFAPPSYFDADGKSFVRCATLTGPFVATFNTLHDFDPATTSLSTMVVTTSGTLKGTLDLTTALQGFAELKNAKWRSRHGLHGTAQGFFLIPFPAAALLLAVPDAAKPPLADYLSGVLGVPANQLTTVFVYGSGPLGAAGCRAGATAMFQFPPGASSFCPVTTDEVLLDFPLTKLELILFRD